MSDTFLQISMQKIKLQKPRRKTMREIELDRVENLRVEKLEEFESRILPKFLRVASSRLNTTPEKLLEFFAEDLNYGRTLVETAFSYYNQRPMWLKFGFEAYQHRQKFYETEN